MCARIWLLSLLSFVRVALAVIAVEKCESSPIYRCFFVPPLFFFFFFFFNLLSLSF